MASDHSSMIRSARRPPIVRRDSYIQDNRSIGVFTSGGDASGKLTCYQIVVNSIS